MSDQVFIQVRFAYNNGTLTPVDGRVSGLFYGYLTAGTELEIDERDFDSRFVRLVIDELPSGDPSAPTKPEVTSDDPTGDPSAPTKPQDLTVLPGITKKHAQTLNEHEIFTYADVVGAGDALMTVLNLSEEKAAAIFAAAEELANGTVQ